MVFSLVYFEDQSIFSSLDIPWFSAGTQSSSSFSMKNELFGRKPLKSILSRWKSFCKDPVSNYPLSLSVWHWALHAFLSLLCEKQANKKENNINFLSFCGTYVLCKCVCISSNICFRILNYSVLNALPRDIAFFFYILTIKTGLILPDADDSTAYCDVIISFWREWLTIQVIRACLSCLWNSDTVSHSFKRNRIKLCNYGNFVRLVEWSHAYFLNLNEQLGKTFEWQQKKVCIFFI